MPVIPQIDHHTGTRVERVEPQTDATSESDWQIVLSNGAVIANHDENLSAPEHLVGKILASVIMSELDTRVVFGDPNPQSGFLNEETKQEVTFNPNRYSISEIGSTERAYPQRRDDDQTLPDDPSPDRVVDEWAWDGVWRDRDVAPEPPVEDAESDSEGNDDE